MSHVTRWLWSTQLKSQLAKIGGHCPSEGEDETFSKKLHDHVTNESRDTVDEIPSTQITKVIVRVTELNDKTIYVLQIGAALFYYKLEQKLLQIVAASLLQIGESAVTN